VEKVIIYGSCYGTARRYAQELSRRTAIPAVSFTDVKDLPDYSVIIYVGALYAGGVHGLRRTLSSLRPPLELKLVIATVGLSDPKDEKNANSINASLIKQLSGDVYKKAFIFHLRGGIDYGHLSLAHKTMMGLLYRKAKALPPDKQTAEVRAMIDSYGRVVDFVDFNTLDPIEQILALP
jgi:hypothetical protein